MASVIEPMTRCVTLPFTKRRQRIKHSRHTNEYVPGFPPHWLLRWWPCQHTLWRSAPGFLPTVYSRYTRLPKKSTMPGCSDFKTTSLKVESFVSKGVEIKISSVGMIQAVRVGDGRGVRVDSGRAVEVASGKGWPDSGELPQATRKIINNSTRFIFFMKHWLSYSILALRKPGKAPPKNQLETCLSSGRHDNIIN